jgi:hypothetical protein
MERKIKMSSIIEQMYCGELFKRAAAVGLEDLNAYFQKEWIELVEKLRNESHDRLLDIRRRLGYLSAFGLSEIYEECITLGLIKRSALAQQQFDYLLIYLRSNIAKIEEVALRHLTRLEL